MLTHKIRSSGYNDDFRKDPTSFPEGVVTYVEWERSGIKVNYITKHKAYAIATRF